MDEGKLTSTQGDQAQQFIDAYLAAMKSDLDRLATRISEIASLPGVEVFALSDEMLERAISLRSEVPNLKPFDEAILAGILVRAARIPRTGAQIFFCDLDGDLVPSDRKGQSRPELHRLYSAAGITVRQDFLVP